MHLAPGTLVTPRLRLVRELGRGGMGAVWVAENLALETEVAVKFILAALGGETAALDRFQREARLAAQLKSPHLAQVFDHGVTDDGTPYIVMELLAGRSLADRLAGGATLSVGETVQVVEQLARALGAAHRGGVVHRDIKPENVFLLDLPDARDGELHVKLLDFGVARSFAEAGSSHLTQGPIGTPAYMSPEQLHDSAGVGAASDLWSLAVLAYRALVGHPPFAGPSAVALWKAIAARSYAPPSTEVAGLPPELDAWFQRAFALEPGDRFPSARALADELARCFPEQQLVSAVRTTSSGARDAGPGTGDRAENAELGTAQFVASAALGIDLERVAPGEPGHAAATTARGTDTQPSAGVVPATPGPAATGPGTTGSGA
ncbi:MAG: serine/threonine protein kinase, partial [Myxococcales bacterium]|nr:serine/threonine protein kinase [Myxococcales bacterium]